MVCSWVYLSWDILPPTLTICLSYRTHWHVNVHQFLTKLLCITEIIDDMGDFSSRCWTSPWLEGSLGITLTPGQRSVRNCRRQEIWHLDDVKMPTGFFYVFLMSWDDFSLTVRTETTRYPLNGDCPQFPGAQVASVTPLGEWLHDYKGGETNSRMQLRRIKGCQGNEKNERDLPCPRGWIGLIVQPGTARSGFAAGMMHQSRAMRWMSAALEFWDNRIKRCGSPEKRCQLERWWIKFSLVVESWLQSSPIPILKQTHQNTPKAGVHMFLFRDIFRITTVCSSQRWFKLLRWVLAADIVPEVPEAVAEDDDMIWQPWWLESGLVMSKPNCFKLLQDLYIISFQFLL